ncbi:PAX3- and PAX7-binding protein 1 isoform X2 [Phlebotomus argentipes]|uniref:PAX3- and PAX7-binding protein 1 isoform X2 n=1 Tax=Phlebotomus argentipes TaxID=94469 RepID=UPI0028931F66|nr:PAX3- and PAX7-binding protein 1 isoform X2 [Phlebotomus argentipes]
MSLFRKPKKPMQRRVFGSYDDDENEVSERSISSSEQNSSNTKKHKKDKDRGAANLLSFDDEEEGEEVFQVKKSSHSKKVMKMLDKERRKKSRQGSDSIAPGQQIPAQPKRESPPVSSKRTPSELNSKEKVKKESKDNSNSIQTEIRTDDFVLVIKKSEPESVVLNGRAALCAGRDDMSSDEESNEKDKKESQPGNHKFTPLDNFKKVLESGKIPDAAMIHAARKRRQKARELGELIPVEEKPEEVKPRRTEENPDDDGSEEEERIDMSAITGAKEREERREKFYSVQQELSDDSDLEMNEWENQQIRKGVTGTQLALAHSEAVLSQYMIQPASVVGSQQSLSTGALLEQAYARNCLEKPKQMLSSTAKAESKSSGPRMPQEILQKVRERLTQVSDLSGKHKREIEEMSLEMKEMKIEAIDCEQKAPVAAAKYRFYQELRGYVSDLVECLDEKVPLIVELEKRAIVLMAKHANNLIERRRQDIRDQAKEISDSSKPGSSRKGEDEEHIRRAAEREGRRTRRRRDRERSNMNESHLNGMSSDDEISDHDLSQYLAQLELLKSEAEMLFSDVADEFCQIREILNKFQAWKSTDTAAYRDAYVSLCLPKIIGQFIRLQMITWNPLSDHCPDIEKSPWFAACMMYSYAESETEESLSIDPDVTLVPVLVEKIILPKLTEQIETCWDPMSTSQTLRLVGFINRLYQEYPSLRPCSKPLTTMFNAILEKIKASLDNDVFIPIFPKQSQDARTSFFQRQFCSGLKLFRNILSWQGILSDASLREVAILSLLNRYLLSAMRVCSPADAIAKAHVIVYTLPRAWLQSQSSDFNPSIEMFVQFLKLVANQLDKRNPIHLDSLEKIVKILSSLHATL